MNLLSTLIGLNLAETKFVMPAINFKKKFETFTILACVLQNTQNLVISCSMYCFAGNCKKIYNAGAQPLFSSLIRATMILVAVTVVVCLSSLILFIK